MAKREVDGTLLKGSHPMARTLVMRGGIKAGSYRATHLPPLDIARPARHLTTEERSAIVDGYREAATLVDDIRTDRSEVEPSRVVPRKHDAERNYYRAVKSLRPGDVILSPLDGMTRCVVTGRRSYRYGGPGRYMLSFRQASGSVRYSEVLTGTTRIAMAKR